MAGVTKEQLKKEIADILKNADLTVLSAKKVRQQLEEKLKCDLISRKKEIDALVMEYVNSREKNNVSGSEDDEESDEESGEEEEDEGSEEEPPKNKRSAPVRKAPAKKSKKNSSTEDDGSGSNENASDEEYSPSKSAAKSKKSGAKKRKESDSDSDEDWKKPVAKKTKKAAASGGGGGGGAKGKGTGFTRALTLSPELAALMGAESLPRHEVVKKMWAMIKERNLYDPKNKQYAICDNDLIKVIGVKRFRTFGMLKYLRPHFID